MKLAACGFFVLVGVVFLYIIMCGIVAYEDWKCKDTQK